MNRLRYVLFYVASAATGVGFAWFVWDTISR